MKTFVLTSDHGNRLIPGFLHQWKKYAGGAAVEVVGYSRPALPKGQAFTSIGDFADYPVNRWSDGLVKYLSSIDDDLVMLFLEDYWLMRPLCWPLVNAAIMVMMNMPDVARFDLTADRLYAAGAVDVMSIGYLDVIEAKGDYSLSFQTSIFRRELLLELLVPGETPWQAELNGTKRLNESNYRVFGSRQWPVRYMITVNKGQFDRVGAWMYPPRTLAERDWQELDKLGLIPQEAAA